MTDQDWVKETMARLKEKLLGDVDIRLADGKRPCVCGHGFLSHIGDKCIAMNGEALYQSHVNVLDPERRKPIASCNCTGFTESEAH